MQPRANNKTIMVIDDIIEGEYLYTTLIAKLGYRVAFYDDPLLALAAVGWVRPVLAVSDVCMPYIGGYTLLEKVRSLFPNMPFLMVSGTPDNLDRVGGIENCRALEKPFENGNFVDMVNDLLMAIGGNEKRKNNASKLRGPVLSFPRNRTSAPQGIMSLYNDCDSK